MAADKIKALHGDHLRFSIKLWWQELADHKTSLAYVDWRADKLWAEASDHGERV